MRRNPIRPLLVFVFVLMLSSCKSSRDSGYPIILLSPLSGGQSGLGRQVDRALKIVEKELRDAHDVSISIHEVDTASQPTVARAEAERALDHYQSKFLVGSLLSGETRNLLQPLLEKGVIVLANGSSDPTIRTLPYRRALDGFFRNWPSDDVEGRAMADYVFGTQQKRNLAVFCSDDSYSRALTASFVRRFRELGGAVNEPEIFTTSTTSFESVLSRIDVSDASHVDGYYIVALPRDLAGIYNTIRNTSNAKAATLPIFSAVSAETTEFKKVVDKPLDRLFFTSPAPDLTSAQYFNFKESYMKEYNGEAPDIVASITYDALHIMIDAVKAGHNDPQQVKTFLYNMAPYPGTTGPTKFDNWGDVVSKPIAIHFYEGGLLRLAEAPPVK